MSVIDPGSPVEMGRMFDITNNIAEVAEATARIYDVPVVRQVFVYPVPSTIQAYKHTHVQYIVSPWGGRHHATT